MRNPLAASLAFSILGGILSAQTAPTPPAATPGTAADPVRVNAPPIDLTAHDGGLRPAIGVETIQVLRANREHRETADNYGWTYNHESMLAYWNGKFYLEYLSNPFGENLAPGRTLLVTSTDGRNWGMPKEIFPMLFMKAGSVNTPESGMATMHQDMGFYVAPSGRLLICAFYGHAPVQAGAGGIGRVVREAYKDGTYGPIYYVRYNVQAKIDAAGAPGFPFYTKSPDAGFVDACNALLANKAKTMQWWGEDQDKETGFFSPPGHEAASVYHRKDGMDVVLWKEGFAALSSNEGATWTTPVKAVVTDGAKSWGQRTKDGRYAMVYVPDTDSAHRWPIAVATSDDGIVFGNLLLVNGDIAPRRYFGRSKDFGIMYMRGITEGEGNPPGNDMWIAFENDKEDIWVSRIPVPIRGSVQGPVSDNFDNLPIGGEIPDWNIRRGRWTPVGIVGFPSAQNRSLQLEDRDPYEYATAVRVFGEAKTAHLSFKAYAHQADTGRLEIEVIDGLGHRPVRIVFGADGHVRASNGSATVDAGLYKANAWHRMDIEVDAVAGKYNFSMDGAALVRGASFVEPASSVERLSFRTGEFRIDPTRESDRYADPHDLPNAGEPVAPAVYNIDDVSIR